MLTFKNIIKQFKFNTSSVNPEIDVNEFGSLNPKKKYLSAEVLQREFDYYRAEKLLRKMLEKGLITEVEFYKIDALNRQTFSPFLKEIMPSNR